MKHIFTTILPIIMYTACEPPSDANQLECFAEPVCELPESNCDVQCFRQWTELIPAGICSWTNPTQLTCRNPVDAVAEMNFSIGRLNEDSANAVRIRVCGELVRGYNLEVVHIERHVIPRYCNLTITGTEAFNVYDARAYDCEN